MSPSLNAPPAQRKPKKLLDQVRDVMRLKHYSIRTERCYWDWIVRFIRFSEMRPGELPALQFLRGSGHRLLDNERGEFLGGIVERGVGCFQSRSLVSRHHLAHFAR